MPLQNIKLTPLYLGTDREAQTLACLPRSLKYLQNLASDKENNKFKSCLLTYNTLYKIV